MKLTIIVPCFNEVSSIETVIFEVKKVPIDDLEIIVVDDFSTDGSRELIRGKISPIVDHVIYHEKNMGKGAALRNGINKATGDIVVIQDADLEYDPKELPRMMELIVQDRADVVYGSRFMGHQAHRVVYFWHMVGNRFLTLISNMFTNLNLTDMETCYKMFRRELIQSISIEEDRFGFEPEITAKLARKKIRFYEVGISYYGRTYEEGKKIGMKDGFRAILCVLKYNLMRS